MENNAGGIRGALSPCGKRTPANTRPTANRLPALPNAAGRGLIRTNCIVRVAVLIEENRTAPL